MRSTLKSMTTNLQTPAISLRKIKVRITTGGILFFNRASGTNVLFDEIQPSLTMISEAPRHVSIALTNACDLTCKYCYAPKFRANLSTEDLKSWLRSFDENGSIGVGFGGGEPTLYPNLAEVCEFATKETNLAVTLTTHGHRLTANLLRSLESNINFVRVSMDGVGATYEANRGRSFDDLIEKIRNISRFVPFGINYVVNSQTISDLDIAIELASSMEAREFLLLPEQPTSSRSGIDKLTEGRLNTWICDYRGKVPLAINESNSDGLPTCDPLPFESDLAAFVHIDACGILKRTSYDRFGVKIDAEGVLSALRKLNGN